MPDNKITTARIATFLSLFGVFFSGPLGKLAMGLAPGPLAVAFWRMVFTVLLLAPLTFCTRQGREGFKALRGKAWLPVLLGGVMLAGHYWTWYAALGATSVFNTTVLSSLQPFYAILLTWLLFQERPHIFALLGAVLSILGIVAMGWAANRGGVSLYGNVMALLSGLFFSFYIVCGRVARKTLHVKPYAFMVFAICMVLTGGFAFGTGQTLEVSGTVLLLCLALAVTASLLGHTVFNWTVKYVGVTFVTMALSTEPVGASILAALLLGDVPTWMEVAGGIVIIAGVLLYAFMDHKISTKRSLNETA